MRYFRSFLVYFLTIKIFPTSRHHTSAFALYFSVRLLYFLVCLPLPLIREQSFTSYLYLLIPLQTEARKHLQESVRPLPGCSQHGKVMKKMRLTASLRPVSRIHSP
jgi:hypothetical protein